MGVPNTFTRIMMKSNVRTAKPILLVVCVALSIATRVLADPGPLIQAHAHNDYYHDRPLLDAIANGFCSVEADVFVVNDELLVAHSRNELDTTKTLESLYLKPLMERTKKNGGRVYPDGPVFTLLVDFKSEAEPTYQRLLPLLQRYESMLVQHQDGQQQDGAVQIIISGNRPFAQVREASPRLAYIDGRLSDLGTDVSSAWMPLISDRWTSHFTWTGEGEISPDELMRLRKTIQQAHAANQRVRFWATPDRLSVWEKLAEEDVDLINTDDLPGLAKFLQSRSATR